MKVEEQDLIRTDGIKAVMKKYGISCPEIAKYIPLVIKSGTVSSDHLLMILNPKIPPKFSTYWPHMVPALNQVLADRGFSEKLSESDIVEMARR